MNRNKIIGYSLSCFFMGMGFAFWWYQLSEGMVLTNMRNSYTWGLYVSGLAFFVGNAAGGLVLSSLIYLFNVKELKPFAKIGALAAFANVTAAMIAVLPDIGRPDRLLNMLLHPQFNSPLIWDVIVLNLYAALSLIYLYLLMLPDLKGPFSKIAIKVEDPKGFSEKWAKRLAPFSLIAAIGIHVVTAWIFATQGAREWWHTGILAPDFVAAAVASGTAVVLVIGVLAYGLKTEHQSAYRIMGVIIAAAVFVHIFLMYNEFVIKAWYGSSEALNTLAVTFKDYGVSHAFEVLAPLIAAILLLNEKMRKNATAMIISSLFLIAGIFVHRFLLMPAAFDKLPLTINPAGLQNAHWPYPIASGDYGAAADTFVTTWRYFPTGVEIAIFLGVSAYVCFLVILLIDQLPIVNKVES